MRYTILSAGDRGMGGLMEIPADAARAGAHPAWLGYVRVPDTDAAAKQIAEGGGVLHRGPDDIPNVGRFAVVADPGGAMFMVMTPLPREDAPPPADPATPGLVGWHELCSGIGQEAAFRFYSEQFGWETLDQMDMGPMGQYRIFGVNGVPLGGMMDEPKEARPGTRRRPESAWSFYVNVEGLDAAVTRIESHGGQVLMGPHQVPGGSWIVQAVDPQGAAFALVSARR
jgi:predicted enzyme related to lactoylglutathione lyase